MSTAVVLLFGMAPALAITRADLTTMFAGSYRCAHGPQSARRGKLIYDRASGDLVHAAGGCPVVCAEPAIPRQS